MSILVCWNPNDNGKIDGCSLHKYPSIKAAMADAPDYVESLAPAEAGDTWFKDYSCGRNVQVVGGKALLPAGDGFYPVIACYVRKPGTHPGNRAWWCDPVLPVFTPVYKNEN